MNVQEHTMNIEAVKDEITKRLASFVLNRPSFVKLALIDDVEDTMVDVWYALDEYVHAVCPDIDISEVENECEVPANGGDTEIHKYVEVAKNHPEYGHLIQLRHFKSHIASEDVADIFSKHAEGRPGYVYTHHREDTGALSLIGEFLLLDNYGEEDNPRHGDDYLYTFGILSKSFLYILDYVYANDGTPVCAGTVTVPVHKSVFNSFTDRSIGGKRPWYYQADKKLVSFRAYRHAESTSPVQRWHTKKRKACEKYGYKQDIHYPHTEDTIAVPVVPPIVS